MKIRTVRVIPVAIRDLALLNVQGVHEPFAPRIFVRVELEDGTVGWGEGISAPLAGIEPSALNDALRGLSPLETSRALERLRTLLPQRTENERMWAFSALEVGLLDAAGRALGVSVSDLLGGAIRDRVDFSAYLFYKWEGHPEIGPDGWGEAIDAEGIVRQAQRMVDEYGFGSLKLKAGMFPPEHDIEVLRALRDAFPTHPLRIDPNGGWSVETSVRVAPELEGLVEYLEDPVLGIDAMSAVHERTGLPLATNMCVVERAHIKESVQKDAVQILLCDHHYWGGLQRSRDLAAICETFGIGVSMHSNSHLGISLAAMTHLAAALPAVGYACDTHYPWNREDDVVPEGTFEFADGSLAVPQGPGLGVEVDEDRVARLHKNYLSWGKKTRDDLGYMRRFVPDFSDRIPRF